MCSTCRDPVIVPVMPVMPDFAGKTPQDRKKRRLFFSIFNPPFKRGEPHHGRHGHDRNHHGCCFPCVSTKPEFPALGQYDAPETQDLQLRSKVAGRTALLALASLTASVTTLPVTAVTTTTATESTLTTALVAEHATGRSVRPLLLDVGSGNDLGGEMEPLAEVVETLGGEGIVVVLPGELGLDVAAAGQRLASLNDIKVTNAGLVSRLVAARFK